MNKQYDKEFDLEIDKIIRDIYFNPINLNSRDKRAHNKWDYKYIHYLVENGLIRYIGHTTEVVMLTTKGYEIFEKYNDWGEYKRLVINKKQKVENAKGIAQRFWWLPIIISVVALLVAVF